MPESADGWRAVGALAGAAARRYWRAAAATLVALSGLAVLAFGPAWAVLSAQELSDWRAARVAAEQHGRLGTEVRDGAVTFVVHTIRCGPAADDPASQGQICTVTLAARNDGTVPVTVPGPIQKLYVDTGAWHLPATVRPAPFGTLAPGEAGTATIGYDLPPHSTATRIEVYADPTSRGHGVALSGPPLPLVGAPAG